MQCRPTAGLRAIATFVAPIRVVSRIIPQGFSGDPRLTLVSGTLAALLVEVGPDHALAASRYPAGPVDLARLIAARDQSHIGADAG